MNSGQVNLNAEERKSITCRLSRDGNYVTSIATCLVRGTTFVGKVKDSL